ncbi:restriction endonuclease subunit S [Nocardiopsis tropica]|uniref:restriction endonuclease subunit S n=1 Tax=Nocardiopsis tropica TaxID=109330 RepID=UPI002E82F84E|nr:restriction endonuclease subunit S [Nocardiopsis tropica]
MDTALNEANTDDQVERPLGEVCEVQAGTSGRGTSSQGFSDRGTPLVRPLNIVESRISEHGLVHVSEENAAHLGHRYRLLANDIVTARTGTLGRFALVEQEQQGWLMSGQLLRLRPSAAVDPHYLVHYLALPRTRAWIDAHTSGSTVPSITRKTVESLPVRLPPLNVQRSIGERLELLDARVRLQSEILETTRELRSSLAELLFAGRSLPPNDSTGT